MDVQQIFKDCYDPTYKALRIHTGASDVAYGTGSPRIDWERVFKVSYNAAKHALNVYYIGTGSPTYGTNMDWQQVVKVVFDKTRTKIKVVT